PAEKRRFFRPPHRKTPLDRACRRARRCKMVFIDNHYPLAGLDPATHDFFGDIAAVGRRGWPGQARPRGDFGGEFGANGARTEHEKLNRTAVGLTRPSTSLSGAPPWMPGTSPGMTKWRGE